MIRVDHLTDEQKHELAAAYLDLLGLMNTALEQCETPWAFFRWNGRGYEVTGHVPPELAEAIKAAQS